MKGAETLYETSPEFLAEVYIKFLNLIYEDKEVSLLGDDENDRWKGEYKDKVIIITNN